MARTSASSRTLTDHDEIRKWAEERGAKPACVIGTGGKQDTGMIRLDFPGYSGDDSLQPISWDEWFKKFDEKNLALLVQDETARGQKSNFNKLISRDAVNRRARASSSRAKASARAGNGRGRSSRSTARSAGSRTQRSQSSTRSRSESRSKTSARGRSTEASGTGRQGRSSRTQAAKRSSSASGRKQPSSTGRTSRSSSTRSASARGRRAA